MEHVRARTPGAASVLCLRRRPDSLDHLPPAGAGTQRPSHESLLGDLRPGSDGSVGQYCVAHASPPPRSTPGCAPDRRPPDLRRLARHCVGGHRSSVDCSARPGRVHRDADRGVLAVSITAHDPCPDCRHVPRLETADDCQSTPNPAACRSASSITNSMKPRRSSRRALRPRRVIGSPARNDAASRITGCQRCGKRSSA